MLSLLPHRSPKYINNQPFRGRKPRMFDRVIDRTCVREIAVIAPYVASDLLLMSQKIHWAFVRCLPEDAAARYRLVRNDASTMLDGP